MKTVKLKKLSIKNFRGFKSMEIKFNEKVTTISGANEMGKSSVLEAFMWLLFGKDSQDRKDYEIKHLVNGKSIPKTEVEVEGVLDIDGEETTLKRQFVERWVKPRGQAEEVFKGNETVTYYNDVPLNVSEYQARINEIVNDTVFKMVTNPLYFPSMKWEAQREQLFQIAGTISDIDIANMDERYRALLDQISGKSFSDFKREIQAKKRKAKEQLEQIQPRIDQTNKLMPENQNFPYIEKEIERLEKVMADIDNAINDKTEAIRQQYERAQEKQREVNSLKSKRQQIIHDANEREKEAVHEANAVRRSLQSAIEEAEMELRTLRSRLQSREGDLKELNNTLSYNQAKINGTREEWVRINAQEYDGSDNCPSCGQLLPEGDREKARQNFASYKSEGLSKLDITGQNMKTEIEKTEHLIAEVQGKMEGLKAEIEAKQADIEKQKEQLSTLKPAEVTLQSPESFPEYIELSAQIEKIEAEIKEIEAGKGEDTAELRERKAMVTSEASQLRAQLKDRDLIEQYKKEIADLESEGKKLAQQIADLEGTEFAMKSFTKTRIEESEKRINELFTFVTFKLFDYTIDGNEIETCVPLVKGVPFPVANSAGKVKAGLDIIKALQRHHEVLMPIFCDNAEGINDFPEMDNQMIFLRVTKDKKLTIE